MKVLTGCRFVISVCRCVIRWSIFARYVAGRWVCLRHTCRWKALLMTRRDAGDFMTVRVQKHAPFGVVWLIGL